jgi:hypothetical protein
MDIITTGRKEIYLNTLKKYHIYEICKDNLYKNDTNIDIHNPICEAYTKLHKITVHTLPPTPPQYSINMEVRTL